MDQNEIARLAREGAEAALEEQLEFLKKCCSVDCPSLCPEGNAKVVAVVDEALGAIEGIEIEHVPAPGEGVHVLGRLRPPHPKGKIILNAHLDTVFRDVSCADHPFHIEGDLAYGLGVGDCKGGVAVAIWAVRQAQRAGLLPDREIVFMFNCDEEFSGTGSGYRFFDRELPADEAYVFEGTGETGDLTVQRKISCGVTIDVTGVRAHSGNSYAKGRSAAVELAHRILLLYEKNDDERGIQFNVGELHNDDPGNVVSGHCTASCSVRAASRADIARIRQIAAEVEAAPPYIEGTQTKLTVSAKKENMIMERSPKNDAVFEKVCAAGRLLGRELHGKVSAGFGDVCWFNSRGCACVDGLGAWNTGSHTADEHIHIHTLTERTALFIAVLGMMK